MPGQQPVQFEGVSLNDPSLGQFEDSKTLQLHVGDTFTIDLELSAKLTDTTVDSASDFEALLEVLASISPAIAPTTPTFDATTGGVDYGYTISNTDLPQATTVDLYWASGTTTDTEIGDPIATTTTDTAQGTYPLQVSASDLADRPEGAKYLLAVADPDNLISPADPSKVAALALADITPTPLSFDDSGGVNYGYTISGSDLPQSTTVDLYWAGGTTTDTEIGAPIATTTTDTAQGAYPLQVSASDLADRPEGAKYLLAVADPDNVISPADPSKVQALVLAAIEATPLSFASDGSLDYGYTISNGDLPEATTVDLYWAGGTTPDTEIGNPFATTTTETAQGTYPLEEARPDFGIPPAGAKYILAVVDPDGELPPSENPAGVQSIGLPELDVSTITLHPDIATTWANNPSTAGGVDFTYQITGTNLPAPVPIALFWASGTTINTANSGAITTGENGGNLVTLISGTAQGTYSFHVPANQLGTPPDNTTNLLVVLEPPTTMLSSTPTQAPAATTDGYGQLIEATDQTNVDAMSVSASVLLSNSVHAYSVNQ